MTIAATERIFDTHDCDWDNKGINEYNYVDYARDPYDRKRVLPIHNFRFSVAGMVLAHNAEDALAREYGSGELVRAELDEKATARDGEDVWIVRRKVPKLGWTIADTFTQEY
jgi:hypothetical protein